VLRTPDLRSVALLLALAGCRSPAPASPVAAKVAAKPEPPPCAGKSLAFFPRQDIWYAARTEQMHDVYQSILRFGFTGAGWIVLERDFTMNRPMPAQYFGEMRGAMLKWWLSEEGVPGAQPEPVGGAKPGYLENMTLYAFAPAGLAVDSTCAGKEWEARWQESERTRTFRYRLLSVDDDHARIAVTGLVKTTHNEWRIEGTVDVSRADGLAGTADLHVTGPGAPQVNDFFRRITITPVANPLPGSTLPPIPPGQEPRY
jgi:hypothetical protein